MVRHDASHAEWAAYLQTLQQTQNLITERQHSTGTILSGLAEAKRRIQTSRTLLRRLADSNAGAAEPRPGVTQEFSTLGDLVARIDQVTQRGDPISVLVEDIKLLIDSETAPEMVMGVLLEGIVQLLRQCIPHQGRHDVVMALWLMFYKRLELMDADAL